MSAYEFPWEQRARRDEELPEDLGLADQWAYLAVRSIYADYRAKRLTREQASAEKMKIRMAYERAIQTMRLEDRLTEFRIRQIRATEQALSAVRKDPTPENALRLCDILDGLERPEVTI